MSFVATLDNPTIRVRHLWHRYGAFDVLRDVSFDVGPGEIYGFIGPNGAGKTTTIRIMSTLLEPMAGRVEIDGIDVTMDPEGVRRAIGYMPDHAGVYDRITVREYLEFFADAFAVPSTSVVDAVLELTDLTNLQDRLVAHLSKGMKQRLQLARILLHDPKILILDEPASDLDPRARIEIRDLLLELKQLGKTIFLSSHILSELSDVCTSVGILERGQLVVSGPIDQIGARLEAKRRASGEMPPAAPPPAYGAPAPQIVPAAHHPMAHPQAHPHAPPQGAPAPAHPHAMAHPHAAPHAMAHSHAQAHAAMQGHPMHPGMVPGHHARGYPQVAYAPGHAPPGTAAPANLGRKVRFRVLGDPQMAAHLLYGGPGIQAVEIAGGVVNVTFVGHDSFIAMMVHRLVAHNVGVVGVEQERTELERIFLEVTRGDLQ